MRSMSLEKMNNKRVIGIETGKAGVVCDNDMFSLNSPSVRNTKHFICDSLMTSDKEVNGYGSIQNRQIHS